MILASAKFLYLSNENSFDKLFAIGQNEVANVSLLLTVAFMIVSAGASFAHCNQTFAVNESKRIVLGPGAGLYSEFLGASCGTVESMRTAIYIDHLAGISDQTFLSFSTWSAARDDLLTLVASERARLQAERAKGISDQNWARLKNTSLATLGGGLTILGCPTSWSGAGALSCLGGLGLAGYGTYDGLTADGFDAAALGIERSLATLETVLLRQTDLGKTILDERHQAYLSRFENMCFIVQSQCQL